jgi:hypothetical protein
MTESLAMVSPQDCHRYRQEVLGLIRHLTNSERELESSRGRAQEIGGEEGY